MPIRTITWTVGEDMRVSPTNHQHAGVQGDDKATTAVFVLPEKLCAGYDVCAEFVNALGEHDQTEVLQIEEGKVSFPLPLAWTQEGGRATIRLVATARGDADETAHTFEGKVVFEGRGTAFKKVKGLIEGAIQRLMSVCTRSVERVEAAGEAAENFMENLPDFEAGKTCYSVFEKNKHVPISVWVGTCAEYDALPQKPNNTIVIKLDKKEPYEAYRLNARTPIASGTNVFELEAGSYTVNELDVVASLKEEGYWPFDEVGMLTVKYPILAAEDGGNKTEVLFEAETISGKRMVQAVNRAGVGSLSSGWVYPDGSVDRVIGQGEGGDWKYRKWESGAVELWCIQDVATEVDKQIGSDYISKQIKIRLPFAVLDPVITGTATNYFTICNGSTASDSYYGENSHIMFRVKRSMSGDTEKTTVRLRVDGRWK